MGDLPPKICFLADSHELFDDRIYWKQAISLKKAGYDVWYILPGSKDCTGETKEGINYIEIQRDKFPHNPILNILVKRMPGGFYHRMFHAAAELKAAVYHIHDLKVNRMGTRLKKLSSNPKVIYDIHEPYPENIIDYWKNRRILSLFRKVWASHIRKWEKRSTANYDLIITTEENMKHRFQSYFPGKPVEVIYNYTNLPVPENEIGDIKKEYDAIYTGGITQNRGAWKILQAIEMVRDQKPEIRMLFLGNWFPEGLKDQMKSFIHSHKMNDNVILKDSVPYNEIADLYRISRLGLGIFLPIQTHKIILQIKIFEYMNYGLPIIGSNFGHINKILQHHQCGIAVNPENPRKIADAILNLLTDEVKYGTMSKNGKDAAKENYRWDKMELELIRLYKNLLDG